MLMSTNVISGRALQITGEPKAGIPAGICCDQRLAFVGARRERSFNPLNLREIDSQPRLKKH